MRLRLRGGWQHKASPEEPAEPPPFIGTFWGQLLPFGQATLSRTHRNGLPERRTEHHLPPPVSQAPSLGIASFLASTVHVSVGPGKLCLTRYQRVPRRCARRFSPFSPIPEPVAAGGDAAVDSAGFRQLSQRKVCRGARNGICDLSKEAALVWSQEARAFA